jgi:hypothetical protein
MVASDTNTQVVARTNGVVGALGASSGYVYWTEQDAADDAGGYVGSVNRAASNGGQTETLATGLSTPGPLVVDATGVYWIDLGQAVYDCTLSGAGNWLNGTLMRLPAGSSTPVVLVTGITNGVSIARANDAVYWVDWVQYCAYLAYSGDVNKLSDTLTAPQVLASGLAAPGNLFVDSTTVYFTSTDSTGTYTGQGIPR